MPSRKRSEAVIELFVNAYLGPAHFCASRAAQMCGYGPKYPRQAGWRLMQDPRVQARIKERLAEFSMGRDEIIARLTMQARGLHALAIVIDERGRAHVDLEKLEAAGLLHLVKKLTFDRRGNTIVEFCDTQAALFTLAKQFNLFPEHVHHTGNVTIDAVLGALPTEFRETVCGELAELVRTGGGPSSNGKH